MQTMGGRGTGKTWRLVNDARDGDFMVVAHPAERDHVRELLRRQGRSTDALRFLTLEDDRAADRLRGMERSKRVYIDHQAHERACNDRRAAHVMDEIERIALLRAGGVHHYPVDEQPCDTGGEGAPHGDNPAAAGTSER